MIARFDEMGNARDSLLEEEQEESEQTESGESRLSGWTSDSHSVRHSSSSLGSSVYQLPACVAFRVRAIMTMRPSPNVDLEASMMAVINV